MLDIWLISALVIGAVVSLPFYLTLRLRPHLKRGAGILLPTAAEVDDLYRRRRKVTGLIRLAWPTLLVYLLLRGTLFAPADRSHEPLEVSGLLTYTLGLLALSFVCATIVRYVLDQRFIQEHPEFSDSQTSLGLRLGMVAIFLSSFIILVAGLRFDNPLYTLGCVAAALVALSLGQKLQIKTLIKRQVEIPEDSPLYVEVADVIERFGFTPKRFVMVPSLIANGAALPDGTVLITTALRTICSDDEIAAILAHELSHARDRDPKILTRRRYLGLGIVAVLAGSIGAGFALLNLPNEVFVPTLICLVVTVMPIMSWLVAIKSQPLEFKCDADTAKLGLGSRLASGLTKLHLFAGLPAHWEGLDAKLLTHPSLQDRLKALDGHTRGLTPNP